MAQSQNQTGSFPTGLSQWRENGTALAMLLAIVPMVFMRKRVGYRKLSLGVLFGMAFVMFALNAVANFHMALPLMGNIGATSETITLKYLGLAFLAVGLFERHKRWKELQRGERWHTRSHGISHFEFLAEILHIRPDLVYRIVDPAVVVLAGLCLWKLGFDWLGMWIALSGVCFRVVEEYVHEKQLERDLDTMDSLLESEVQGETVAHFDGQNQVESKARSLRETGGIPTGADAGLEAQIARRKKQAAAARAAAHNAGGGMEAHS